jgi:hypothetical protein
VVTNYAVGSFLHHRESRQRLLGKVGPREFDRLLWAAEGKTDWEIAVKRQKRWEHEAVLDRMQARLDRMPEAMTIRRQTVEHTFGTLKAWMGGSHFLTKTPEKVKTEMSLQVLAYNMKRMINILGVRPLMQAIAG